MESTDAKSNQSGNQNSSKQSEQKSKASSDISQGLRDLLVDELKDIYWAEKALVKGLPKMIKKASTEELVDALSQHFEVTKKHVSRLEKVFSMMGEKAEAKKCEAMEGLLKEAEQIMEDTEAGVVRDAGIILAGQKVEHYEIATYGTLYSFAKTLGEDEAAKLLQQTLNEEKEADVRLSEIAEAYINAEAADSEHSDDQDDKKAKRKQIL
jgi:ferritin-like metal-binding protein YciE